MPRSAAHDVHKWWGSWPHTDSGVYTDPDGAYSQSGFRGTGKGACQAVLVDAWFRYPAAVRYYLTSCSVPVCCWHMFAL